MKSVWNQEKKCRTYTCPICGYTHDDSYYYTANAKTKPFIECVDSATVEIPQDYAPNKLVKLTRYICPECGVIQVDTSSLD